MFHQAYIKNNLKMCNNLSNPIEKNIVNLLVIHTSWRLVADHMATIGY